PALLLALLHRRLPAHRTCLLPNSGRPKTVTQIHWAEFRELTVNRTAMHVAMSAILLSSAAGTLLAQSSSSSTSSPVQGNAASFGAPVSVARTTKAVNYRRASGSLKVELQGTELMPGASAEVKVENKNNRMEIELKFAGLEDTTKFGLEYLAYVLWAV